ncbi:MAG TPA: hypothetical protein VFQ00_13645 [Terriglobales bacterium]|nr:hypothetical protein [Terriglobales bacterium]
MGENYTKKASLPSHSPGTRRGEEETKTAGKEPGREKDIPTARSATSINPKKHAPIDKKMPSIQPA